MFKLSHFVEKIIIKKFPLLIPMPDYHYYLLLLSFFPIFSESHKRQADYCLQRMKPFVDKTGLTITDAYDYTSFTESMFIN